MDKNRSIKRLATLVPPWGIISTALILLPILAFMTVSDINRQKAGSTHQLLEKGAALIRSFEAGTRAGMMMEQWGTRIYRGCWKKLLSSRISSICWL